MISITRLIRAEDARMYDDMRKRLDPDYYGESRAHVALGYILVVLMAIGAAAAVWVLTWLCTK